MKIAIVTDSSNDLSEELLFQYNIREIPLKVIVGSTVKYDNRMDFSREEFYSDLINADELKIEEPSVDEFLQLYKKICLSYDSVISIHESSKLSDTAKNARTAVNQGVELFRKLRFQKNMMTPFQVRVIDSRSTSIGLGLLVLRAAELLREDVSFTLLANELERISNEIFVYAIPDTTAYFKFAKGKVKSSFFGSAFDSKPISVCNKGEITTIDRKRGFDSAASEAIKLLLEKFHSKQSYDKVGIAFAGDTRWIDSNPALMNLRVELASSGIGSIVSEMGASFGHYFGPKSVAMAIINSDINVTDVVNIR